MACPAYSTSPCSAIKEEIPLHKLLRFSEIPSNPSVHTSSSSEIFTFHPMLPSLYFIQTSNLAHPQDLPSLPGTKMLLRG